MRGLPLILLFGLAACAGGSPSSETVDDPTAQNVASAAAEGKSAAVTAAIDCSNKPDFVPVFEGAQVTTCVSGPDGIERHVSGNIVYLTDAKPEDVLGWSRAQSNASGLAQRLSTPTSYSAGEERRRSLMVVVEPYAGRTRVTINWGREV